MKKIKLHRALAYKCNVPLEYSNHKHCKYTHNFTLDCTDYIPLKCIRKKVISSLLVDMKIIVLVVITNIVTIL